MSDDYIFVTPSIISGAARVFDVGGTFDRGSYLLSDTPAEADARAMASDWAAVGGDLRTAIQTHGQEESKK